jgi:hypothetical protein|tara:strand:- start:710 stop:991 length:282 start_codon:yes stop_codon:yes gene_type:complete
MKSKLINGHTYVYVGTFKTKLLAHNEGEFMSKVQGFIRNYRVIQNKNKFDLYVVGVKKRFISLPVKDIGNVKKSLITGKLVSGTFKNDKKNDL